MTCCSNIDREPSLSIETLTGFPVIRKGNRPKKKFKCQKSKIIQINATRHFGIGRKNIVNITLLAGNYFKVII